MLLKVRLGVAGCAMLLFCLANVGPAISAVYYYGFDKDTDSFWGTDGWSGAYCADPWTTELNGGVTPHTDDACELEQCSSELNCGYGFGFYANCDNSDPFDNHVQVGSTAWKDYVFSAKFRNSDDDAVGFMFRYVNSAQFYLFLLSRDRVPAVGLPCSEHFVGSRLMRIKEGQAVLLGSSEVTYQQGIAHQVSISVTGAHMTVQFDANSDGSYSADETLFDLDDAVGGLNTGKVGLYAYDNGAAGSSECMAGECWFDDVKVEILALGDDPCQGISYEGQCQGDDLFYCVGGKLFKQECAGCCMFVPQLGVSACVVGDVCLPNVCIHECQPGAFGCSDFGTHAYSCGEADGDPCLDLVIEQCTETGVCNPGAGECIVTSCEQDCQGKACGADGCGGSCGDCPGGSVCEGGQCGCVSDCFGKECGPDGCGGSCGECPDGGICQAGQCDCLPDCIGKECGPDGCGGDCGECPGGSAC